MSTGVIFILGKGGSPILASGVKSTWPQGSSAPGFSTRRITFHSMRHSFATLLAANGVDILTISKMLTHKSVKNTQIYAKVVDERAREASMVISLK